MPPRVVPDAGPIIHLAEADALSLLALFDELHVPATVLDEIEAGTVPGELAELEFTVHEVDDATDAYPNLDPGETTALVLAERLDLTVLTDDLDAREAADERSLEVHGSIGVVLYAYSQDHLTTEETRSLLHSLETDTTLYLSRSLVDHAIRLVERDDAGW